MEPDRGKGKTNSGTIGSGSGLRHGPFGTSGSGTILFGAAGAPMGDFRGMFIDSTCYFWSGNRSTNSTWSSAVAAVPLFIDSTCHFWSSNCSTNSTKSSALGDFTAIQ